MGKIGDLFVRLGLKSDDYKKGMDNAKKETRGFGDSLDKMKAGALAVWAAIGTAVIKFGQDFIQATNKMGDAWAHTMSSIKASYHSVIADMTNYKPDTSSVRNFFKGEWEWIKSTIFNAGEAGDAAKEMSKAFDAEFELVNSVRLQREQVQQELNELYITMRDTTLKPEDRKAAAERYKALLQPIADAEVAVYGNMLQAAIQAWQAGNELDREYSVAELTEFFTKIGTEYEKMEQKFPDLMRVYETRKGDAQNQVIFDTISKLQQATNEMSDIDRQLSRVTLSINKSLQSVGAGVGLASDATKRGEGALGMEALSAGPAIGANVEMMTAPDIFSDAWLDRQIINGQAFGEAYMDMMEQVAMGNQMLEDTIISSVSNGMQALTDMLFGLEDAGAEQILAAFLQPFAQTMVQMGEMIMAEGIAMEAFKKSIKNPTAAIAAGLALIAVGSAIYSGLQAMTANPAGGGATPSPSSSGAGSVGDPKNYESTLTVQIEGKLEGADIVLAAKKTQNKWNR